MDFWSHLIKDNAQTDQAKTPRKTSPVRKRIMLGALFPNRHLTYREAQCIQLMLQGLTMKLIGHTLDLSPRTIEYYLNNVKQKLNCRNKKELIKMIHASQCLKKTRVPI
jgi:DNA-binding CsgD family transcriptional regulator